ncbi:uncharacterized protein Z518_00630 [Rhinocladiella mackenziei CBS 650.93]|uniref:Peptidase S59 domain-containing protein n=1 Tax=Rhinocladiella mackenziei CBS 650.93 TaxID=1442369 RepID=A0A0D2JJG6_9EURO|nr:uncharacterized protein Z518_00630 [Rhinocladiella mackenziei CBS 650.93]KIX09550.1 hypothetical protein Z518_00630 [Rhinocladiella mackenziei CBS 650.93]
MVSHAGPSRKQIHRISANNIDIGFGSNPNTAGPLFGNIPASTPFGSSALSTTSGFLGNTASNTGGFGSGGRTFGSNTNASPFRFGRATQPAFGSTSPSSSLFGQGGSGTTRSFGTPSAFSFGTALSAGAVPPSDGTASVPFAPTVERDGAGQNNSYQSVSFMAPYSKYSFEELRLADYNAGRRYGSATWLGGSFGPSTFGRVGSGARTDFGPFDRTMTSTGFGSDTSTAGFGGGGLFGNKPAGGLFGQQSSSAPSGGLFGTAGGASTQFGSGSNLFGSSETRPSPFGASAPSFSFGSKGTTTAPSGGGLFGSTGALSTTPFGGNQQKPLFGSGPGGFGFGSSTTQSQPSGGLFGRPVQGTTDGGFTGGTGTGGGLFGSAPGGKPPTTQSTFGGGGTTTGGLFGNVTSTPQQQSGGLFGTTPGFSFGTSATRPASTPLFGAPSTAQQPSGATGGFGGLFGTSPTSQQGAQQQPDFKVSSLNDPNPYGQSSIWTGLPMPTPENSKPIYTPLIAAQKEKESQSKPRPSLRLRKSYETTRPRRPSFGFSKSAYRAPRTTGLSAPSSPPQSRYAGDEDRILSPDAFSPSRTGWSSENMRRLTIDRSDRSDLFRPSSPASPQPSLVKEMVSGDSEAAITNGEPSADSINQRDKHVTFDKRIPKGQPGGLNGETAALARRGPDETEGGAAPRDRSVNGSTTPEAEPVRGNDFDIVPGDRESIHIEPEETNMTTRPVPQPGEYWMKPTRTELGKMPHDKLQHFTGFEIGRQGCGRVNFNGPVDLTTLPLDDLYQKIVQISLRSITVYPDASSKPPVGTGLNVPATLSIENSWPRACGQPLSATSRPLLEKHINRLKKMQGTEFINYEVSTGVWTFRVAHFTRYALAL